MAAYVIFFSYRFLSRWGTKKSLFISVGVICCSLSLSVYIYCQRTELHVCIFSAQYHPAAKRAFFQFCLPPYWTFSSISSEMHAHICAAQWWWRSYVEYHKLVYYQGDGGRKISLSAIRHLHCFRQVMWPNQIIVCPLYPRCPFSISCLFNSFNKCCCI